MTSKPFALDIERHRAHGWLRYDNYSFAAMDAAAPLLLPELAHALPFFPMGLAKRPQGGFQLVALLGLHAKQNLFVDAQGHWLATYIPGHYRAHPFFLHAVAGEGQRQVLCFNPQSGLFRERPDASKGEARFFDDEGKPQPLMTQVFNFLQASAVSQQQTQLAVDALDAAGLLAPWSLQDGAQTAPEQPLLTGLYRVNEPALKQVDAGQLLALRDSGALALAHAQLFSMPRLAVLRQLSQKRTQAQAPAVAQPDFSVVEKLFGSDSSDTIKFNF